MKAILFFFCFWVLASSLEQKDAETEFSRFVLRYQKNYSPEEAQHRFRIFKENLERIESWTQEAKQRGASVPGVTKFADLTPEEFKQQRLMAPRNLNDDPCSIPSGYVPVQAKPLPTDNLPASFDWRERGAVTSVKDQGSVGTCWAFSTAGNIEGLWYLKTKTLASLSVEQLNDCDYYDCGVFGGWPCRAYQYIIQRGGIESEAVYPYCVGSGNCFPCPPVGYNATFCGPPPEYCNKTEWPCKANAGSTYAAHISGWKTFMTDELQLKAQLVENGPLSVLMDASGFPPLQYHSWGIYDPWSCDPTSLDHGVLLVGYGTDDGTDYWLVKNSWGTDWSDLGGYFKIVRGKGTCGINTAVTSGIV